MERSRGPQGPAAAWSLQLLWGNREEIQTHRAWGLQCRQLHKGQTFLLANSYWVVGSAMWPSQVGLEGGRWPTVHSSFALPPTWACRGEGVRARHRTAGLASKLPCPGGLDKPCVHTHLYMYTRTPNYIPRANTYWHLLNDKPSASDILSHLILTAPLSRCSYCPHFIGGESEAQRLRFGKWWSQDSNPGSGSAVAS